MEQHTDAYVGLDVAKLRHAVAVADDGRNGEIRYLGEIDAASESVIPTCLNIDTRPVAMSD